MDKLKPMPEREKFQHAFEMVRLYQRHVLPFVEEYLGYAEMHNLRSIWRAAIIPIHEDDPDTDKYNQAYSNALAKAVCAPSARRINRSGLSSCCSYNRNSRRL